MTTAFCLDLDGTVTTAEILPCIAADVGIAEEIATLTRVTIEGIISFEESLRLRCAILGQVPVGRVHSIIKDVPLHPDIVRFIRDKPEQCFLVTGNLDIWISPLLKVLPCRCFSSKADRERRGVRLTNILDKGEAVKEIRELGFDRVVAVGEGSNDVPMMRLADFSVAFGEVHAPAAGAIAESDFVVHEGSRLCKLLSAL